MSRPADRAWKEYAARFLKRTFPKIIGSSVGLTAISGAGEEKLDVQRAAELGALLLLDKPLVLLVAPGGTPPRRLARAADVIIADWSPDHPDAEERLTTALRELQVLVEQDQDGPSA